MKDQRVAGFIMVLVLVLSLIGVSGLSGAQAQTSAVSPSQAPAVKAPAPVAAPAFLNAAPGDAILSVSGQTLKPIASDIAFNTRASGQVWDGLYCTSKGINGGALFNTPVNLPQGTLVKSLRMYFYDVEQVHYCTGFFAIVDLKGYNVDYWMASSPEGSVGMGYADSPAINHTIDNTKYSYMLLWRPTESDDVYSSNLQLQSLQLNYTPAPVANKVAVIPLN